MIHLIQCSNLNKQNFGIFLIMFHSWSCCISAYIWKLEMKWFFRHFFSFAGHLPEMSLYLLQVSFTLLLVAIFSFSLFFFLLLWWVSEKAMATHSSTLAWEIPWTEEPGRLQSMGSGRVRHNWVTSLSLFTFMHWRRKWQPTPVFLPWESQGWKPGGLPSMGSHRVGHDWRDLAAVTCILRMSS